MHHLLQLDCANLPSVDPDMPNTGTISIFITGSYDERSAPDLMGNEAGAFRILYQTQAPDDLPERPHPDGCPALGEDSYACQPVRYEVPKKKMNLLQRLVNTQPKAYSKSNGTGYFAAVPLEATVIDSHPVADAMVVLDALGMLDSDTAQSDGVRARQILGYAPHVDDLKAAHLAGHRACSDEKAAAAYDKSQQRDDVLLAQFGHDPELNFNLLRAKYALQFRIKRADLQQRAFDRAFVVFAELSDDGLWFPPQPDPQNDWNTARDLAPSIALKPLTPFETPSSQANYFCGDPQLPADVAWPCRGDGYPLGFLMQIDCASLPQCATINAQEFQLPSFPKTGTIFVFADDFMDEPDTNSIRLIYTPDSPSGTPTRTPPEAQKTPPEYASYNIKHRANEGEVAHPEPKRPFDPVGFVNIRRPDGGDPDFDILDERVSRYGGALPHEEKAFPSVTPLINWLPNYVAIKFGAHWSPSIQDSRSPVRNIPHSFPWRWSDISMSMVDFPQGTHRDDTPGLREQIFGSALIAQGTAWSTAAQSEDMLARIPEADRAAYRQWLVDMDGSARNIPKQSAKETPAAYRQRVECEQAFENTMDRLVSPYPYVEYNSLPATLHYLAYDQSADDIPDEMREIVAELVRFDRSDTQLRGNCQHHRPDPDLMFAGDPTDQSKDSEVMLLSLASGSGLPVTWGDCCWLQIWIEADDLAAGRFDRIRPTIRW